MKATIRIMLIGLAILAVSGLAANVFAQGKQDPGERLAVQRQAMLKLSYLVGEWRGSAWTVSPSGGKHTLTQTERVGPFLDGALMVVEGRGYEADGTVVFNALGIISYDPDQKTYAMRSYAQGRAGDFPVTLTDNGFQWEIPAGPMTIRYTAVIQGNEWTETGDRIAPGKEPVRFFEMKLARFGDSTWPSGGALGPQ
jgi:hypothetical protein